MTDRHFTSNAGDRTNVNGVNETHTWLIIESAIVLKSSHVQDILKPLANFLLEHRRQGADHTSVIKDLRLRHCGC
jgi:hypothetical protein